ncbi:MAG TPA: peptidoglycan DD-metalloendopeptidase family protein [Actinomycetota bacterium]|nr:peptidoglycan DD-metalloendopeptidase family protein [Actinomycetota bacterium]
MLGAALIGVPAQAGTESRLEAARDRLEAARAELTRVTRAWQDTEAALARAQDDAAAARAEITRHRAELNRLQESLNDRVMAAYMSGGSFSVGAILASDSIQDAADRLQYTLSVVQGDADLASQVSVETELLRRQRDRLDDAVRREQAAVEDLEAQRAELSADIEDLGATIADLQAELDAEEEAQLGIATGGGGGVVVTGSGAIQTCPVAGPNSFVDSFGDPRPGGRSHEGIDMIAAAGTPVVAVAPGTARTSSAIGGLGVVVEHPNGDWTFYAHLGAYGTLGPVSAGTVIGTIGSQEVSVPHLHFEYHPSGGPAVNPYSALLAVC